MLFLKTDDVGFLMPRVYAQTRVKPLSVLRKPRKQVETLHNPSHHLTTTDFGCAGAKPDEVSRLCNVTSRVQGVGILGKGCRD